MNPQDLNDWVPAKELPAITNGKVTLTAAKKLLQHRATNGLEARGGACVVGRQGYLNVSIVLQHLFGSRESVMDKFELEMARLEGAEEAERTIAAIALPLLEEIAREMECDRLRPRAHPRLIGYLHAILARGAPDYGRHLLPTLASDRLLYSVRCYAETEESPAAKEFFAALDARASVSESFDDGPEEGVR